MLSLIVAEVCIKKHEMSIPEKSPDMGIFRVYGKPRNGVTICFYRITVLRGSIFSKKDGAFSSESVSFAKYKRFVGQIKLDISERLLHSIIGSGVLF
jgi:hypothetical protein